MWLTAGFVTPTILVILAVGRVWFLFHHTKSGSYADEQYQLCYGEIKKAFC